jgi:nitronate monooxygenase
MVDGDTDAGASSCDIVAGLIRDIPTVGELLGGIMGEGEQIIGQCLARCARASSTNLATDKT